MNKRKKGAILLVVCLVIVVLLILTTVFFSATISEKKFSDMEKFAAQALSLAEAGANHGVSELRKRIRSDLNTNVQSETSGSVFQTYVVNNDPLGLLSGYAGFTIQGTPGSPDYKATLTVLPLNLLTQIQGNYTATITVTPNGVPTSPQPNTYVFAYKYIIQGTGTITATQPALQRTVKLLNGHFNLTVQQNNLARYALFTNNNSMPGGGIVWFTNQTDFTGPLHTNTRFSFFGDPSGTFNHLVTQHLTTARFYNNDPRRHLILDADTNPPYDMPNFVDDFQRGVDLINLPSAINQQQLKDEALGGMAEPQSNGVYVPVDGDNVSGGIYVRGDATINLDKDIEDAENKAVFKIQQGEITTDIILDYASNTTTVDANTYQGIPDGISNQGPLLYVANGQTTLNDSSDKELTVQKRTNMTISCENDIIIQSHIRYQEYTPSPLSAEGFQNMLGLLVWGGNSDVRIETSAPNDIEIHSIIMSEQGVFSVDSYATGSPRGTATLLGGAITSFYGPFGTFSGPTQLTGYGRNFVYDSRVMNAGMYPPYFPTLANFISYDDGGLDIRLRWQEQWS